MVPVFVQGNGNCEINGFLYCFGDNYMINVYSDEIIKHGTNNYNEIIKEEIKSKTKNSTRSLVPRKKINGQIHFVEPKRLKLLDIYYRTFDVTQRLLIPALDEKGETLLCWVYSHMEKLSKRFRCIN